MINFNDVHLALISCKNKDELIGVLSSTFLMIDEDYEEMTKQIEDLTSALNDEQTEKNLLVKSNERLELKLETYEDELKSKEKDLQIAVDCYKHLANNYNDLIDRYDLEYEKPVSPHCI